MKRSGTVLLCFLLLGGVLSPSAAAQELAVGGQAVGIEIEAAGVLVAGVSHVQTAEGERSPAEDAGLEAGDFITAVNGAPLRDASALLEAVTASGGAELALSVQRGGRELSFRVAPAYSADGAWMLGMWLRDRVSGVGTLTFYDPVTGVYGALGHGISDADTGASIPLSAGSIREAEIVSVTKGSAGAPGELNGLTEGTASLGSVERNCPSGIYGHLTGGAAGVTRETGELRVGPAQILCTCEGRETREYAVEISRIYREGGSEHVLLEVTDPALLALTGGIVQGMSGSPILQDGKLVGAVTHVFVNDPARGYGISIQDMLAAAGIDQAA